MPTQRAVDPEHVAKKILNGIECNQYMVFTSADIKLAYWLQRKFALPYELTMRSLNNRITATFDQG
jgi:hypothetical protein